MNGDTVSKKRLTSMDVDSGDDFPVFYGECERVGRGKHGVEFGDEGPDWC